MIYTIGYGNRSIDEFINILTLHDIEYLGDVRTFPRSGYNPEFNQVPLTSSLATYGIRYLFMGDQLGGNPDDQSVRVPTARSLEDAYLVDYRRQMETPRFQEGISRLLKSQEMRLNLVLMCSEAKPEECHRTRLIGEALQQEGVFVNHIDENEKVHTQKAIMLRLTKGQPSLPGFGPPPRTMVSSRGWRVQETSAEYEANE